MRDRESQYAKKMYVHKEMQRKKHKLHKVIDTEKEDRETTRCIKSKVQWQDYRKLELN